jgi:hypothetical protein
MTVSMGCFLEEYRYYVREVAGDAITPQRPRLTRARFEPGTELPYLGRRRELLARPRRRHLRPADRPRPRHRLHRQRLHASTPGSFNDDSDWIGPDDTIYEADPYNRPRTAAQDDWLYNDPGDDPPPSVHDPHLRRQRRQPVQLYFVRVTVGRTVRPDPTYQAPPLRRRTDGDWIEDRDYDSSPGVEYKTGDALKHRRRVLQTVVDMRNI